MCRFTKSHYSRPYMLCCTSYYFHVHISRAGAAHPSAGLYKCTPLKNRDACEGCIFVGHLFIRCTIVLMQNQRPISSHPPTLFRPHLTHFGAACAFVGCRMNHPKQGHPFFDWGGIGWACNPSQASRHRETSK